MKICEQYSETLFKRYMHLQNIRLVRITIFRALKTYLNLITFKKREIVKITISLNFDFYKYPSDTFVMIYLLSYLSKASLSYFSAASIGSLKYPINLLPIDALYVILFILSTPKYT